jgi:hypothetical protein
MEIREARERRSGGYTCSCCLFYEDTFCECRRRPPRIDFKSGDCNGCFPNVERDTGWCGEFVDHLDDQTAEDSNDL